MCLVACALPATLLQKPRSVQVLSAFRGLPIRYHEACAVYCNGSGDIPVDGMPELEILKFYEHYESCSNVGLKCQHCGKRGANLGCYHGPCKQTYHFPCARLKAFKGELTFSASTRAMACPKHISKLPLPHEQGWAGAWLEGAGGWDKSLVTKAKKEWLPHLAQHKASYRLKIEEELRQMKQTAPKKPGRGSKHSGSSAAGAGGSGAAAAAAVATPVPLSSTAAAAGLEASASTALGAAADVAAGELLARAQSSTDIAVRLAKPASPGTAQAKQAASAIAAALEAVQRQPSPEQQEQQAASGQPVLVRLPSPDDEDIDGASAEQQQQEDLQETSHQQQQELGATSDQQDEAEQQEQQPQLSGPAAAGAVSDGALPGAGSSIPLPAEVVAQAAARLRHQSEAAAVAAAGGAGGDAAGAAGDGGQHEVHRHRRKRTTSQRPQSPSKEEDLPGGLSGQQGSRAAGHGCWAGWCLQRHAGKQGLGCCAASMILR